MIYELLSGPGFDAGRSTFFCKSYNLFNMNSFNEKQLVQFGQYLLSQNRKRNFKGAPRSKGKNGGLSLVERLALIHDADVQNFKEHIKNQPEIEFESSGAVVLRPSKKEAVSE